VYLDLKFEKSWNFNLKFSLQNPFWSPVGKSWTFRFFSGHTMHGRISQNTFKLVHRLTDSLCIFLIFHFFTPISVWMDLKFEKSGNFNLKFSLQNPFWSPVGKSWTFAFIFKHQGMTLFCYLSKVTVCYLSKLGTEITGFFCKYFKWKICEFHIFTPPDRIHI
jgi:hypothetical protein